MNKLEDLIQSNRDKFNDLEPDEGHFERFQEKLSRHHRQNRRFPWGVFLKAAAVAILVVLSGLWIYENVGDKESSRQLALEQVSPEVREAHFYYTSLMEEKYERIRQFDFKNEDQKEMLLQELREMDAIYSNIRDDLRANPNDSRVVSALIRHYQMKLEVMNQILNQLENINTQQQPEDLNEIKKDSSYETTSI
jgi:cytochrome c-type biogenesis protein CcmH/NrfG